MQLKGQLLPIRRQSLGEISRLLEDFHPHPLLPACDHRPEGVCPLTLPVSAQKLTVDAQVHEARGEVRQFLPDAVAEEFFELGEGEIG